MPGDDIVVFMSYAHDDDLVLSGAPNETGFVTTLDQQLRLKLRDLGARNVSVWRDRRRIDQGDQFRDFIDDGLKAAEFLIVVMSQNWVQRPYCRKEFDTFLNMRKAAGVANPAARMILVGKGYVDWKARPQEVQGQNGYLFYSRDDQDDVNAVTPFFNRGKCADPFYAEVDELASDLQKRALRLAAGAPAAPAPAPVAPIVVPNGRTVFLSKPAGDMKAAYVRLVNELQGKGFIVTPDPNQDPPDDAGARAFFADAIDKAEAFVHLVGDRPGFAPEGLDPIVKLQVALAREKAAQVEGAPGERIKRRIIWAPKILDEGGGAPAAPAAPAVERDPLQALERFDRQIPTDKIDSDILSKFVEYLFQYLTETAPSPAAVAPAGAKFDVYLSYHPADEDYVGVIAKALRDVSVKPRIPVPDSDADSRRFNGELLAKCDAVTLCWGAASEVWVRSEADRLSDWQSLGRKEQFVFRGLIAGPPPTAHKNKDKLDLIFSDGQFDKMVDLAQQGAPTPSLLADFAAADAKP
jgi:hypothetical protein